MKSKILMAVLVLILISLWGCDLEEQTSHTMIQVSLQQTDGCTIQMNSLWVEPGDDAVFLLDMENGYSLASTDYDGSYSAQLKEGMLELTLENIRYPTRVQLELTSRYATITYLPNGGSGSETIRTYDLTYHIRPNTSIGTDIYSRDGYTLVGWNTESDGSGQRIGLGSRVSCRGRLTLYAQWEQWTDAADFSYITTEQGTVTITGYTGSAEKVVIPAVIEGKYVTAISAFAFENCGAKHVILPVTMDEIAADAFVDCALEQLTVFDNIQSISDACFTGCENLQTLYINAIEAPYGYDYRKESVYADKVDILIEAQGQQKLVFYAGCSMWYNLDGLDASRALDGEYQIINMGLNGTVNSPVQMQIMGAFLEEGDVLLHSWELGSKHQLMEVEDMRDTDGILWCGIEYNYDLFALVDLRTVGGVFDSWCNYLDMKKTQTTYQQYYTDENDQLYLDQYGCVPIYRDSTLENLADPVRLDPNYIDAAGMNRLQAYYDWYQDLGVTVYISYACLNMDEVPVEQQGNVELMDALVKETVAAMNGPRVISNLEDYLFTHDDFYDTNYHLRTTAVKENTQRWLRDLLAQMEADAMLPND